MEEKEGSERKLRNVENRISTVFSLSELEFYKRNYQDFLENISHYKFGIVEDNMATSSMLKCTVIHWLDGPGWTGQSSYALDSVEKSLATT